MVAGLALETWLFPHYVAPLTGVLFALVIQGLRHLRVWGRHGRRSGLFLAQALPLVCVAMVLVRIAAGPLSLPLPGTWPMMWYYTDPGNVWRAAVLRRLEAIPGRHLVLVRYSSAHSVHDEWVFNEADIDRARVVWARAMGGDQDGDLLRYFGDRLVWLIEPDSDPQRLSLLRGPTPGRAFENGARRLPGLAPRSLFVP
jgi:hypothetical protein